MSISLNNHEDRIKALESDIEVTKSGMVYISGYKPTEEIPSKMVSIKFKRSNIKMAFGMLSSTKPGDYRFELPFKIDEYTGGLASTHNSNSVGGSLGWGDGIDRFRFAVSSNGSSDSYSPDKTRVILTHVSSDLIIHWIAIGILYTYRYIIKSLLIFTPLSYLFNKEV